MLQQNCKILLETKGGAAKISSSNLEKLAKNAKNWLNVLPSTVVQMFSKLSKSNRCLESHHSRLCCRYLSLRWKALRDLLFLPSSCQLFFFVAWVYYVTVLVLQSCFEMLCALVVIFNFRLCFLFLIFCIVRVTEFLSETKDWCVTVCSINEVPMIKTEDLETNCL